jgi:hypothetical protein
MKVIGLLCEQLVEEEEEENVSYSFKKMDYSQISFCKLCQEGKHVMRMMEEIYSQRAKDTRPKGGGEYNQEGMLEFKCVHGKKVLTMRNSLRKPSRDVKKKPMDMRGGVNQVYIHKYQRNLFRSSGSLDELREDGIKGNKGENPTKNKNKVSRILFEMKEKNREMKRRTSLDMGLSGRRGQGKRIENNTITYSKDRKTVSEKKIRNIQRKGTFDIEESLHTQTKLSLNNDKIGDMRKGKKGTDLGEGKNGSYKESEEDLYRDSDTLGEEESNRMSFSEKFLKNHTHDIFDSKKGIKGKHEKKIETIPLNLKKNMEVQSNTPRFRISKQKIENNTEGKEEKQQIETLGNSSKQFVFKNKSRGSSRQSHGFCPLTEENTMQYNSREKTSKSENEEDFINVRNQTQGTLGGRMKTISECTQESISKKILSQLKNEKSEVYPSDNRYQKSTRTDVMKTRSDYSGNLIRNSASIDRMMKKSFGLYNTEDKNRQGGQSVFGELKESFEDDRSKSFSSGMYNDRRLFSKKKEAEMEVISSQENTIGMSVRERTRGDKMYPSERVSSRDFILEKMMSSNEKLTTSALEKMLEQGQKSALMLKECFKDLLFKERTTKEGNESEKEKEGDKYQRKKSEWRQKMEQMQREKVEYREKIVRLETLLQTQEKMMREKDQVKKESNEKEIEMMKRHFEQGQRERERVERQKEEQIQDWKSRFSEMEKKNEILKDKILYLEIRAGQMRFWDTKTGDSVQGNKSMYGDIMYSKSTIPKSVGRVKWDTRSQMDDREMRRRGNEYPKNKLMKSEITLKERSKSLFNLGEERMKAKEKAEERQIKERRNVTLDKNELGDRKWNGKVSSVKSINSPSREVYKNHSSFRSMRNDQKEKDIFKGDFRYKRRIIKVLKLMKVDHCLSVLRKKKGKDQAKKMSLKEVGNTGDIDEAMNFQTFQDSNKIIGNNFFNTSMKELQVFPKEDINKTQMSNKLDVDYSKNVFLNSGLVAEAKEMEQELKKEKVVLIQELNSETRKLRESEQKSSHFMKLSGDLLKFLYCQALCIDTGLDTFEEFMEEPVSDQMGSTGKQSFQNSGKYDKLADLNMQAVKEVEEELEVDTSPRDQLETNIIVKGEQAEMEHIRVPGNMKEALLSEKIETEIMESVQGMGLSHGNERLTYESELIAKSNGFLNESGKKHFSYSLPNHEMPPLVGSTRGRDMSNTLTKMPREWTKPGIDYRGPLEDLPKGSSEYDGAETDPRDFPEININPESLEYTLREVTRAKLLKKKDGLKGTRKEIGRGLMEEYISGENRRYFIKDGIKMRVDEQGYVIQQEKMEKEDNPQHRNVLYNQTYSDSNSPSLSHVKESRFARNEEDETDQIQWTGESNSEEGGSDDLVPSQQNFMIEDDGNIYVHRHHRQMRERKQIMDDTPGLPQMTKDLHQTVIPQEFDPDSRSGSSSEMDSDEELNIYELSSRHVRSSFGSIKEGPSEGIMHLHIQNKSKIEDLKENTFKTLKINQQSSKKSFKKNRGYDRTDRGNVKSDEELETKDLFYTMKEKNDYSQGYFDKK